MDINGSLIAKGVLDQYRRKMPIFKYHLWNADLSDRDDIRENGGFSEKGASGRWRFVVWDNKPNFKYLVDKYGGYRLALRRSS